MSFPVISPDLRVYTLDELAQAFQDRLPVYFDTMVLQNLWKLHSNPRASLMQSISALKDRTYLPYQAQVELYRHAYTETVLNSVPTPGLFESSSLLKKSLTLVLDELRKVRPSGRADGPSATDIRALEAEVTSKIDDISAWHFSVDARIAGWLGSPVDVKSIRRGEVSHVLLDEVADCFEVSHLLPKVSDDCRAKWRSEYQARINRDEPVGPGRADKNKASLDLAAGDFYMWREILDHCKKLPQPNGFIFVTEERKPDLWESQQSEKVIRRIDPRIQGEVIDEIGGPMLVVSFDEFIEFTTADADERKLLVDISEDARSSTSSNAPWTASAYLALLEWLAERGYEGQRDVVIAAARGGGYITREQIGEVLGWGGENRYLTRFRVPVDRAKRDLVDLEVLGEEASDPLWAVYEGPGEAIGYAVFNDFVQFQSDLDVDGGLPGN